jgi:FkbM family methyltransferase
MGIQIVETAAPRARLALSCLSAIPPSMREQLLFGGVRRQSFVQRLIGGPASATIRYSSGILSGLRFDCFTNEKYFWMGADYERELAPLIRAALSAVSVVYDIGAHAGFWSLVFASLCPTGQIFAFEPDPANRARLEVNAAQLPNIRVLPFAVSDRAGTVRFEQRGSISHATEKGGIAVRTIALDSCELPTPGFVKMDIEGHGAMALAGARATLASHHPKILAEIHNREEQDAMEELRALGYELKLVETNATFPFHILAEVV